MNIRKILPVLLVFIFLMTGAMPAMTAMPAKAAEYNYSCSCFYGEPYIFEIGWNVSNKTAKTLYSKRLDLSDKVTVTLFYDDSLTTDMSDKDITAALKKVLSRIRSEHSELSRPVVLDIKDTGDSTPEELTEKYYNDDNIMYYSAVLPFADIKTRQAYLEKAYDDDEAAYFSVTLDAAGSTRTAEKYLDKAYKDDNITFFSICRTCLEDALCSEDFCALENSYAMQACRDERYDFASVCGCDYEDICGYYRKGGHHGGGHHHRDRCGNWD